MKEIENLRKQLNDVEFEMRSLEKQLKSEITTIKDHLDGWCELGIIDEAQRKIFESIDIDQIKKADINEFKSLHRQIKKIMDDVDSKIMEMENQIIELENM